MGGQGLARASPAAPILVLSPGVSSGFQDSSTKPPPTLTQKHFSRRKLRDAPIQLLGLSYCPFPLVSGLSAHCMCSLTSWLGRGDPDPSLQAPGAEWGAESNDLRFSALLWLPGAASRRGKRSRPRPLLIQGSGHAEARGRLRVHLHRKSTLVATGAGRVLAPLSALRPVSVRCAYPRFHVAPRSMRSRLPPPDPLPAWGGQGVWCGRHE